MQHFLEVEYHGKSHLPLVFYLYTHSAKGLCRYQEHASDLWDIQWYTTKKHCINSGHRKHVHTIQMPELQSFESNGSFICQMNRQINIYY